MRRKVGEIKMTDRAYIVSRTLENKIAIAESNDQNTMLVTLDVLKEILALLKEQESVVRCKDCKFRDNGCLQLEKDHYPDDDWFCADGERK